MRRQVALVLLFTESGYVSYWDINWFDWKIKQFACQNIDSVVTEQCCDGRYLYLGWERMDQNTFVDNCDKGIIHVMACKQGSYKNITLLGTRLTTG